MNTGGTLYGDCEKCGDQTEWDRPCSKCGAENKTADRLAKMLKDAIVDEIPDPLAAMRRGLMEEHQKREREKRK